MMNTPAKKKKVIAIANEKGGVAKTTTTISLGGAFVEAGYDVLLVDLDTQANLTIGLGLIPSRLRRSIADVLMNSASLVNVSKETSIPGLDVVPSGVEMGLAERFLPMRQNYEFLLKNALANLPAYDIILLDCPPSLGAVTYNALTAADMVIAPTQPEYYSAYGLRSMMVAIRRVRGTGLAQTAAVPTAELVKPGQINLTNEPGIQNKADNENYAVENSLANESKTIENKSDISSNDKNVNAAVLASSSGTNPNLVYNILITMMDRRNKIHRTLAEQLNQTFGSGLLKTVIEIDTKLRESAVAGVPITHYFPQSRSSHQYRQLAQEIIQNG